ncbi:MAG: hypothetical protein JWN26_409 [Candidatus Saccharibacteria bacterium]|nr:hypothetical protein [Candidatus Saccharibacteria bacterium]
MRGEYLQFSVSVHYYQYLIGMLFIILGLPKRSDANVGSVFHRILIEHLDEVNDPGFNSEGRTASNKETYLYSFADDIVLLYLEGFLLQSHIKRIRSANDGEVRGVIYELTLAASFVRLGYKIKWLTDESQPEFTAIKDSIAIDVEAKRRNRHNSSDEEYKLTREIRAFRANFKNALTKTRTNKYLVCLDSDLPPAASFDLKDLYEAMSKEFGSNDLKDTAILMTNYGFEYLPDGQNYANSSLVIKDKNSIDDEVLEALIRSINADMPDAVSQEWPIN